MNVDRALHCVVIFVDVLWLAMGFWANSLPGDSGAGIVFTGITYIFFSLAVPLCTFGVLVSLVARQGIKVGLLYGLSGSLGLTVLIIVRMLFWS